ncbi:hypothetical protein [Caulobacter sp. NIBR2454]|uniref:hypothetical protein n=1 Tax=Caulobacter sp. NIBR2454 TaxID=3015996 RepID=UPI0022B6983B|nr:hypothetical protein [Caulobacter sp. NIBR2454]
MFEFRREWKKVFGKAAEAGFQTPRDGLTGGDVSLLELLDIDMLSAEARSADVAAGRISAKDKGARLIEAAVIWREVARRTGDVAALRKAAAQAEAAVKTLEGENRLKEAARARCEQAACAMLGAELFGDEGLNAAAETVLSRAKAVGGANLAMAGALSAGLEGRRALSAGTPGAVLIAARAFDEPLAALDVLSRRSPAARLAAAEHRLTRADLLIGCAGQRAEPTLLDRAIETLDAAAAPLDAAYEPLTLARIAMARGSAQALLGELLLDTGLMAEGVETLVQAAKDFGPEQSPLDWARGQVLLGGALQILAETTTAEHLFEQAVTAFDRALSLLKNAPTLPLRAAAANNRAVCLARCAELTGDLTVLDVAEAGLRIELVGGTPRKDPLAWAVTQMNLARLYEARAEITGRDDGRLAAAATALAGAFDVFAEHGCRSMTDMAAQGLERLRAARTNKEVQSGVKH